MPELSPELAPSSTLTIPTGPPPPGVSDVPPSRFIIFTDQWLNLQSYITSALNLPMSTNDFTATYGDFDAGSTIKQTVADCVRSMKEVRGLATDFGSPMVLKSKLISDPKYLITKTPPADVYGNIVWLANQIYDTASTFTETMASLQELLQDKSPDERRDLVVAIFNGPGGLKESADRMLALTQDLIKKMLLFDQKITAANEKIQHYIGTSSSMMAEVNRLIGQLKADIEDLGHKRDDAYQKWRDFTISAVTVSVGLMVFSLGLLAPLAVAAAAGLGAAAGIFRAKYNTFCELIATKEVDLRKKTQLQCDMTGFNVSINQVGGGMKDFIGSLQTIESVWLDISLKLGNVSNIDVDKIGNMQWFMQALKINDATKKWHDIGAASEQFTQRSLVNFEPGKFGSKMP